jgi:hypothetical protein
MIVSHRIPFTVFQKRVLSLRFFSVMFLNRTVDGSASCRKPLRATDTLTGNRKFGRQASHNRKMLLK